MCSGPDSEPSHELSVWTRTVGIIIAPLALPLLSGDCGVSFSTASSAITSGACPAPVGPAADTATGFVRQQRRSNTAQNAAETYHSYHKWLHRITHR